jgi:hypothetical protein
MTEPYTATVGPDVLDFDTDLYALLRRIGAVHEQGDCVAVWQGPVLVLAIDGAGHTTYLSDPEAHRV